MKSSQVFFLLVGIALLKVNLADGEEARVAGTEASPTATGSSVPPSPQEAGGTVPPQREKEVRDDEPTGTYEEKTIHGTCVRTYHKHKQEIDQEQQKCFIKCIGSSSYLLGCKEKCESLRRAPYTYPCGLRLSWGAIAGIIIGVILLIILLGIAGGCLICCHLKKKRGVVNGQPFQNVGQPAAAGPTAPPGYTNQVPADPPVYANQAPPPYANLPPTAPPVYANQVPADPPVYANQVPPPYANLPPTAPSAYVNQAPAAPPSYANQAPPAYANQPPTAPNG